MNIEDIWSEYRSRIKAFLHSRVSNSADVDDLLQEISIKTFTGLGALEDHSRVQSWLFQTTHRTIIDYYRKSDRARDLHPDDLWYSRDEPETHHALEKCVEPFIAALPNDTAQLLTAIDLEGRSQKDYATDRGLSYSTLKSRVRSARAALRTDFEKCCDLTLDSRGNISEIRLKSNSCNNC